MPGVQVIWEGPLDKSSPDTLATIETERLILRPFGSDDLAALAEFQGDPEVMQHYGGGSPLTAGEAARVLNYHMRCRAYPCWAWAVALRGAKGTSVCIGQVTAAFSEWHEQEWVEAAWILAKEHWGKGYGSEAIMGMLEHGRDALDWKRVLVRVSPDNTRSAQVIERLGFDFVCEETSTHGTARRCFTLAL